MNETIKTIMSRRSTRSYKPEQIKKDELDLIIECGLWAPSAMNSQCWHFTVIQNKELIDWLSVNIKELLPLVSREMYLARNNGDENYSMFYNAPTVLIVSGKAGEKYQRDNCAYAVENMSLAAESLGIGSCIIGVAAALFNSPKGGEYAKEFGVPEGYELLYAMAFGYIDKMSEKKDRAEGTVNYIL